MFNVCSVFKREFLGERDEGHGGWKEVWGIGEVENLAAEEQDYEMSVDYWVDGIEFVIRLRGNDSAA
jgi:hypothetical protein